MIPPIDPITVWHQGHFADGICGFYMFCASETFETLISLGKSMDISERKQLICVDRVGFPELQQFCPSILLVPFKLPTTIHPQVISHPGGFWWRLPRDLPGPPPGPAVAPHSAGRRAHWGASAVGAAGPLSRGAPGYLAGFAAGAGEAHVFQGGAWAIPEFVKYRKVGVHRQSSGVTRTWRIESTMPLP